VPSIADASAVAIKGSNINLGSDYEDGVVNYAMRVEQRLKRKKMDSNTGGKYINLDILQGTLVNCERLFSIAKHILSDRWKKTSPRLFEALLFLKANRKLWNVYAVGVAMGRSTATRVQQQQGKSDDDAEAIDRLYYY